MLFSLQNIRIRFNAAPIIEGLSFAVENGSKLAIKGKSGAGKSSLLNVITGFVRPEAGQVFFEDQVLSPANIGWLRSRIAYLPQQINFSNYTVSQFLNLPFSFEFNKHLSPNEAKISRFFNQFHLNTELLKSKMQDVSGGEKQRIALVACLLLQRDILLLDEPTSALDKESKNRVMNHLFKNPELTIISASHDSDWLERCSQIINLDK